jgi:hypothetical protein
VSYGARAARVEPRVTAVVVLCALAGVAWLVFSGWMLREGQGTPADVVLLAAVMAPLGAALLARALRAIHELPPPLGDGEARVGYFMVRFVVTLLAGVGLAELTPDPEAQVFVPLAALVAKGVFLLAAFGAPIAVLSMNVRSSRRVLRVLADPTRTLVRGVVRGGPAPVVVDRDDGCHQATPFALAVGGEELGVAAVTGDVILAGRRGDVFGGHEVAIQGRLEVEDGGPFRRSRRTIVGAGEPMIVFKGDVELERRLRSAIAIDGGCAALYAVCAVALAAVW